MAANLFLLRSNEHLHNELKSSFDNELSHDTSIHCANSNVISCHRLVLCASSELMSECCGDPVHDVLDERISIFMPHFEANDVKFVLSLLYMTDSTVGKHVECIHLDILQCLGIKYGSVPLDDLSLVDTYVDYAFDSANVQREVEFYGDDIVDDDIALNDVPVNSMMGDNKERFYKVGSLTMEPVSQTSKKISSRKSPKKVKRIENDTVNSKRRKNDPNDVHHSEEEILPIAHSSPKSIFTCQGCESMFASNNDSMLHIFLEISSCPFNINGLKQGFTCPKCDISFADSFTYSTHVFFKHIGCGDKDDTLVTRSTTLDNMTTNKTMSSPSTKVIEKRSHVCKKCGKAYETLKALQCHEKNHQNPFFVCDFCDAVLKTKNSLVYHRKKHVIPSHKCEECQKVFKSEKGLKYHLQLHEGKANFLCDDCGRGFITRHKLSDHRRTSHTLETPYKCDSCELKFSTSSKLIVHVRRAHTYERPYACDVCNWRGLDSSSLIHHRKRHKVARIETRKDPDPLLTAVRKQILKEKANKSITGEEVGREVVVLDTSEGEEEMHHDIIKSIVIGDPPSVSSVKDVDIFVNVDSVDSVTSST